MSGQNDKDDRNADDVLVNINTGDTEDTVIDIIDDTPEEDRGRKPAPKSVREAPTPDDDEIASYGERAQARIKQLSHQANENRRIAEERERIANEATLFAQKALEENKRLREMFTSGEKVLVGEAKARIEAQLGAARRDLKDAAESGDTEKLIKAQEALAKAISDQSRLGDYTPTALPAEQKLPERKQAAPASDPAFEDWRGKNKWFMTDREMTSLAFGLHQTAVDKGIRPDTAEYYKFVDDGMRRRYPEKFEDAQDRVEREAPRRQPGTVVAPASRSNGNGKSTQRITLTSTQVTLARRLGLKPEEYAAQVLKEQRGF